MKENYEKACHTVALMHATAVGEVTTPKRGVVEDEEDLRLENARLKVELQYSNWLLDRIYDELKEVGKPESKQATYCAGLLGYAMKARDRIVEYERQEKCRS